MITATARTYIGNILHHEYKVEQPVACTYKHKRTLANKHKIELYTGTHMHPHNMGNLSFINMERILLVVCTTEAKETSTIIRNDLLMRIINPRKDKMQTGPIV